MSKSKIQVKPFLTTMDDAMRVMMYNRLMRACEDAGGDFALLAEDSTTLWRYCSAAVVVINAPFEFARPTDSSEALFANFNEWLRLPLTDSRAILDRAENNEPQPDPAKAPPDMVGAEAKND